MEVDEDYNTYRQLLLKKLKEENGRHTYFCGDTRLCLLGSLNSAANQLLCKE